MQDAYKETRGGTKYNDAIPTTFKIINSFNDVWFKRESANQIKHQWKKVNGKKRQRKRDGNKET